ncbi:MAG: endonuclease III [Lentimicrobiaceae bacterium]
MSKKDRYKAVISYFESAMPVAETELVYKSPYQLLVAVILSAQCTDKRVNILTTPFFEVFPDAESLSKATETQVFNLIKSCSYPNNKARNLIGMARTLVNEFKGIVPSDIDELQRMPGVGRKTANVIASVVFKLPAMAVDTHVFRVSNRIGLTTNSRSPLETEKQLVKFIPEDKLAIAHHWLILHGRYVCMARKPQCAECGIRGFCRYYAKQVPKTVD